MLGRKRISGYAASKLTENHLGRNIYFVSVNDSTYIGDAELIKEVDLIFYCT